MKSGTTAVELDKTIVKVLEKLPKDEVVTTQELSLKLKVASEQIRERYKVDCKKVKRKLTPFVLLINNILYWGHVEAITKLKRRMS